MKLGTSLSQAGPVHAAGVCIIALIAAGGYIGCVAPARAAQDRNAALRASLAEASEEESGLRRRQRETEIRLREAREAVLARGVNLRPSDQLNAQVERVSSLAAELGLVVDSLSSDAPVDDAQFRRVPLRLSGRAGVASIADFMRSVRARLPDVTVRAFEIRADLASPGQGATVQMELDWHTSKSDR
jgi:Tfp pilus assembly protein PilO